MAQALRRLQNKGCLYLAVLLLLTVSGCAVPPAKVTLVNPKTGESETCPPQEGMVSRMITREQAEQQRAWYVEFLRTHNRVPTPMEGCIKGLEIRGFVRKPE